MNVLLHSARPFFQPYIIICHVTKTKGISRFSNLLHNEALLWKVSNLNNAKVQSKVPLDLA